MTERAALGAFLAAQRDHVLGILEGLTETELRRPLLPSGWSCLGVVQHLTLDVERFWFRAVMGRDQGSLPQGDEAWVIPSGLTAANVFDAYRAEIEVSDRIIAERPLDGGPAWWPHELFPDLPPRDLRRAILHVTTETACHAGHLDAVRELIDGRQWLVLPAAAEPTAFTPNQGQPTRRPRRRPRKLVGLGHGKKVEEQVVQAQDRGHLVLEHELQVERLLIEGARRRGVEFTADPEDRPWGRRVATFVDPSGHQWELAQDAGG